MTVKDVGMNKPNLEPLHKAILSAESKNHRFSPVLGRAAVISRSMSEAGIIHSARCRGCRRLAILMADKRTVAGSALAVGCVS